MRMTKQKDTGLAGVLFVFEENELVIAGQAKQSSLEAYGLLRRCAPRNDGGLSDALAEKPQRQDLAQDGALDRLVGRRRIGPPPAVRLHRPGGGNEAIRHRLEIGLCVIEAEDQAAGADPREREPFR